MVEVVRSRELLHAGVGENFLFAFLVPLYKTAQTLRRQYRRCKIGIVVENSATAT